MMEIKPIRSETDYQATLKEVEKLLESQPGTPVGVFRFRGFCALWVNAPIFRQPPFTHCALPCPNGAISPLIRG